MKKLAEWMEKVAKICQKAKDETKLDDYKGEFDEIFAEVKALAVKFKLPTD